MEVIVLLEDCNFSYIFEIFIVFSDVVYLYVIINNIIEGIVMFDVLDLVVLVVVDMFFNILLSVYDVKKFGLIYVGV